MSRLIYVVAVLLAAIALVFGAYFVWNSAAPKIELPPDIQGVNIEYPPPPVTEFLLTDQDGQPFGDDRLRNKWSLLFFGYTNCPDVCPNSLRVMQTISQRDDIPSNTQFVFVSVDPKRDTQQKIKVFVSFFNPKFIGLRGEREALDQLTMPLGAVYEYDYEHGDGVPTDDYLVNHFAAIYVINPNAELVAYILPPHKVERFLKAYQHITQAYGD